MRISFCGINFCRIIFVSILLIRQDKFRKVLLFVMICKSKKDKLRKKLQDCHSQKKTNKQTNKQKIRKLFNIEAGRMEVVIINYSTVLTSQR